MWSSHKTANHESIRRARSPRDPPSVEGGHPRRVCATKGVRPRPRAQILRDQVRPLLPELPVSMVPVLLRLSLIPPKTPRLRWVCVAVSPLKRPPRMPNKLLATCVLLIGALIHLTARGVPPKYVLGGPDLGVEHGRGAAAMCSRCGNRALLHTLSPASAVKRARRG